MQIRQALGGLYHVTEVSSEETFREAYRPYTFDLIILDMRLRSGREGLDLLRYAQSLDELQPVIMVSAYGDTDATLDSVEAGAMMFLHKSEFSPELIARMVEAIFQQGRMRRQLAALEARIRREDPAEIVGLSAAMHRATQLARRAADDPEAGVIVFGPPGSERDVVARFIHDTSRSRASGPFVAASAAGYVGAEAASELIGPSNGAARSGRKAVVEEARGGVLFLDHANKLPETTAKLLGSFICASTRATTAGANDPGPDVQFVAGSVVSQDDRKSQMLRDSILGRRVLEIVLPPLRERKEDIPLLAQYALQTLRRTGRTSVRALASDTISALEAYPWPGNSQELRSAIESGAIQAEIAEDQEVRLEHLPAGFGSVPAVARAANGWDYRQHLAQSEIELVDRAISRRGINQKNELASALGYNDRFVFMRRLKRTLSDFPDLQTQYPRVTELLSGRGMN